MKARNTTPAGLIRRLHGWELLHLREHAAALEAQNEAQAAEIERLREELLVAQASAESWREDVMQLQEEGMQLGLTQQGRVIPLIGEDGDRAIDGTAVVLAKGAGPGVWNRWSTYCGGRRVLRAPVWGRYSQ